MPRPYIILPTPPPSYAPLSDVELAKYRSRAPAALLHWRRQSWLLQLAEHRRLVPIKGSLSARIFLVKRVLPNLFPATYRETGRYVRNDDDLELALGLLGDDTRKVEIKSGNKMPMTLRVVASSRADALDLLEGLGLDPTKPNWRYRC